MLRGLVIWGQEGWVEWGCGTWRMSALAVGAEWADRAGLVVASRALENLEGCRLLRESKDALLLAQSIRIIFFRIALWQSGSNSSTAMRS